MADVRITVLRPSNDPQRPPKGPGSGSQAKPPVLLVQPEVIATLNRIADGLVALGVPAPRVEHVTVSRFPELRPGDVVMGPDPVQGGVIVERKIPEGY